MKSILITDSLFIQPEHEQKLKDAGFEIARLDKPEATEEELVEAIKGKHGYILGGIEKLTDRIIDAADQLEAIVFTGIGYKDFIPNHEYVTKKGIAIGNTPDAPTHAVAEWAVTMALAMNRNIFDLGRAGTKKFMTSKGIQNQKVGIIGLGRIGKEIASMLQAFKPESISYFSRNRHPDAENSLGLNYKDMNRLLSESDIIFLCVSKDAGKHFIGKNELHVMKRGALLVTFMAEGIIDDEALLEALSSGKIRIASDHPIAGSDSIPMSICYPFNASSAFNTESELKLCSDIATETMINLLNTKDNVNRVN